MMTQQTLGASALCVSRVALGCMHLSELGDADAARLLEAALECGINFFDHADIYGQGRSEEIFGRALPMTGAKREAVVLQSKCGIRPGFFDFSKEQILSSVDASLRRLGTEYLDVLLLHRPDTLMEPEEVGEAFQLLKSSGKVRQFGVSNQTPATMELLQSGLHQPIVVNQLQFSITNTGMIDSMLNANMKNPLSLDRDGGVLEYCRLKNITIQPWSPFQYGTWDGVFLGNREQWGPLNDTLERMAKEKGADVQALVIAWILRHPAKMQPIVGTTKPARLRAIAQAGEISLTREEWYEIYRAAGNQLP